MADAKKIAAEVVLKFLGSGHTQKSALSLQPSRIDFRRGTLPRIF
jgi:hypothetical protein